MRPWRALDAGPALGLFLLLVPALATAAPDPALLAALDDLSPGDLVEISLENGTRGLGHLESARADSLVLVTDDVGTREAFPTDEIVRIRARRSNAGRGAGWGGISGAVVGGGLGFLSGLYLSSINDTQDSDVTPVVAFTGLGAAAGAGVFALAGLGIGSLTGSWRDVYGPSGGPRPEVAGEESAPTRLDLAGGVGSMSVRDERFSGFAWRFGLSKPISAHVEMGPHFEFIHLDGAVVRRSADGTEDYVATDNTFHASLGVKAHLRRTGFGPYAAFGSGWYWGNGAYLGGHVGGGLRYLGSGGIDLNLDTRYHFNITEIDRGSNDGLWTLTAGVAFDL